jgi:Tfp pilus assembly protein PilP
MATSSNLAPKAKRCIGSWWGWHCVYVNAVKDGQYLGTGYGKRLGRVIIGLASVGCKRLVDLDIDEFTAMIREARELTR